LTGAITSPDDFEADDFRRHSPRFQGENFAANLALVSKVQELAAAKGCTPGQLALAWTMAQPGVVPIPGTKRRSYLEENAAATKIVLSAADLRAIDAVVPSGAAAGLRYPEAFMPRQTPSLSS
jgi:aryl-alcohol dehydrogenase-like predicted oxidoreductase